MGSVSRQTALRIIYWNLVAAVLVVCFAGISYVRRIHRYDDLIVQAARRHQVDPRLVSALIWQESRFVPDAVGGKKEIGLMQVTVPAAKEWARAEGVRDFKGEDLFNPATNIEAGTWYLARAVRRWAHCADPLPFALAEYNAGHTSAVRWAKESGMDGRKFVDAIGYPTTRKYVSTILQRYRGRV